MYVKLSDTEMATRWLLQFKTLEDRVTAKELLDSLNDLPLQPLKIAQ